MNRKIIRIISVICLVFVSIAAFAQKDNAIKIGEKLPNIEVSYLVEGKATTRRIADLFKGKQVILDFWATWCSPCVKSLKRYDSLNVKYNDRLLILPVTYENKDKISLFMDQHFEGDLPIASIVDDSLLSTFFPHRLLPHEVWINKDGIVEAITNDEAINEKNLTSFLQGAEFEFHSKKDQMAFDWNKPYHVSDSLVRMRSMVTDYDPSIGGGFSIWPLGMAVTTKRQRVFAYNSSVLQLYYHVYLMNSFLRKINRDRIELKVKDTTKVILPKNGNIKVAAYQKYGTLFNWKMKNIYTYELILPKPEDSKTVFREYMLFDLNRSLPYKGSIVKRKKDALVLVVKDKSKIVRGSGRTFTQGKKAKIGSVNALYNYTTDVLVGYLNALNINPVVDETKISYPVDLINLNLNIMDDSPVDLTALRKQLNENGFDLVPDERMVDILVIEDKE